LAAAPVFGVYLGLFGPLSSANAQDVSAVVLPEGVRAVWDIAQAFRQDTATRSRVCINGLWRWQPAAEDAREVPSKAWGYYKVPGNWPGIQDYMQSDYQTLYSHPSWAATPLGTVRNAWHERTITIPRDWAGRRIALELEYVNSFVAVLVDGKEVGRIRFPAGQVDLTQVVRPGATHTLSLLVVAMPLKAVMESYTDTNAARQRPGTVERRGLCGDAWLSSEPATARLRDVRIETSFRQSHVRFDVAIQGLAREKSYQLRARIRDQETLAAEFFGPRFTAADVTQDRMGFVSSWMPAKLWDLHTPTNQYDLELSLVEAGGDVVDIAYPVRFGFREFWIQGKDFYLNGTRLYLSLVPLDNAQVGAALATYAAARESFLRLQSFGINFVYGHNYGCEPGAHLSFNEILRAADDTGMLVALSQPHFSAYDWKSPQADRDNGYLQHAAFYVGVAGSHPSVVAYAMSHNATGYNEDMNPDLIDGVAAPRDTWSARNAALATRCEAIVKRLDPARLVYHHASGNLGALHAINFYPNFVPIQELDDWFGPWSGAGVKPVLLVEYGAPFGWDWTMYRGWYQGKREFGSAVVPWEYCLAEWNAQFLGDSAYRLSEAEKRNLRWEAKQFTTGRGWHRWDYPIAVGDERLDEVQPVQEAYTTHNWRAFRTWGVSGNSPWEHDRFWKLRDGFQPRRRELTVDWERLQRPGYSPDYIDRTYARFDLAYERTDWVATPTARSLLRNNAPVLAWIAGGPERFTAKDHCFYPGETVTKQVILLNNSRQRTGGVVSWRLDLPAEVKARVEVAVATGDQVRVPVQFQLPAEVESGTYRIRAAFRPEQGDLQEDVFEFSILPRPALPRMTSRIALFDPPGQTAQLLADRGIPCTLVEATNDLARYDVLLIGKNALTVKGAAPALERVREGLKVVVFEQAAAVLEQRLGFRVQEYGLRQAWPRLPGSSLLAGISAEHLRDWRGASTLLSPRLEYQLSPKYNGAPTVRWCGLEVPRLWRCGNRGTVASVLIEKPPRGAFLPIIDGGYALQYSPLLEYREGRGVILFCQLDVTGRTHSDPVADTMVVNILRYIDAWRSTPWRSAVYAGEAEGLAWLASCGIAATPYRGQPLGTEHVLIVAPGSGPELGASNKELASWIRNGGRILALGLDASQAGAILAERVGIKPGEHIAAPLDPGGLPEWFAGMASADLHNRDPRTLPLVTEGARVYGGGVLAATGSAVLCQLRPWTFSTKPERFNQRRTFVRTSFGVSRLLANLGVPSATPLLERFGAPVGAAARSAEGSSTASGHSERWLDGLYLTQPTEWDDPYRFFRW
jgi:hypothetical protein